MKIQNKRQLQQIALNRPSDIDFKDFIKRSIKMYCIKVYNFKFTYSPLGKAFEKQAKRIEGQWKE